jgi:AdoMet-dependent heme synthase
MAALRKHASRLRFSYNRSFSRSNPHQLRRFLANSLGRPAIRHPRRFLSIGLTHRCQCRCDWCATGLYRKDSHGEMTTGEVEQLLQKIEGSRYVFDAISYLGGECLLRKDIYDLVRRAAQLGLFVHLSTNGLKLDDECVKRLIESGLNSIFVSISPDLSGDEHSIRRQERVLEGICLCVRRKLPCFFSVCVRRENVFSGDLERTLELARQLGAAGVRFMPIRLSGKWLNEDLDKTLDENEEWKVRSLCDTGFAFMSDDCSSRAGAKCLTADHRIVYVSPYGDVQPCHFFPFSFGNVRITEFDEILERMWSHDLTRSDGYTCFLHDPVFRSQNIASLRPDAGLPVPV